jgi:mono/diheme cytochrome c family protein
MVRSTALAASLALLLAPAAALAEDPGDPARGLTFARKHCAECHGVEGADDISPEVDAPNFAGVANTQGMTARALVVWLQTSHPTMPNLMLEADDRDDVVAYIMSLKGERH